MGQYCREVEIEVEIEPIEREARMRIYTPKFCYLGDTLKGAAYSQFLWKVCHPGKCITPQNCFPLKVNTIRPDKPITVPAQGLNLIIAINKTSKKFKKSSKKVL